MCAGVGVPHDHQGTAQLGSPANRSLIPPSADLEAAQGEAALGNDNAAEEQAREIM